MNKTLKYILTITLFLIIGINNIQATSVEGDIDKYDANYIPKMYRGYGCELMCQFDNNKCTFDAANKSYSNVLQASTTIYYCPSKSQSSGSKFTEPKYLVVWVKEAQYSGKSTVLFSVIDTKVKIEKDDVEMSAETKQNLANGTCPANGYISTGTTQATCFGTEEYCKKQKTWWGTGKDFGIGKDVCPETRADGTKVEAKTEKTDDNAAAVADKYHLDRINVTDNKNYKSCSDLIGGYTLQIIQKFFKIIYVAVPFLVLVLGMLDFGKAVLSSKEDEMKKAQGRFIKRVMMGVLVFLVPTIINILFYVVNFAKDPSDSGNFFNYVRGDICIDD